MQRVSRGTLPGWLWISRRCSTWNLSRRHAVPRGQVSAAHSGEVQADPSTRKHSSTQVCAGATPFCFTWNKSYSLSGLPVMFHVERSSDQFATKTLLRLFSLHFEGTFVHQSFHVERRESPRKMHTHKNPDQCPTSALTFPVPVPRGTPSS
jgi:hypothetical protein